MKIAIINYGAGNLKSVANALNALGKAFEIVDDPCRLKYFDKVILPGVGAASNAMAKLNQSGFTKILPKLKVPMLGICLGLQLFSEFSQEGNTKCLSIIPGEVKRFKTGLKIPQMGWNKVKLVKESSLTKGIPNNSFFYFANSYYFETKSDFVVGRADYDVSFAAIVQKDNFYATQFHPEKSGEYGMKLLNNFCNLC